VVNSHIAWSNCLTPLFTTLAFWALPRAARSPRIAGSLSGGPALALAGLLFGLALQTHPLVATLLPGAAVSVLWRGQRWLRTRWPYLALALFLDGYGNVLLYNWETGFESLRSAQRIRAEYGQDQQAAVGYLPTLGALLLLLARVLGGAVDQRGGPLEYLGDPVVVLACALSVVALLWLARRGQPLPLLVVVGFLLLLPLFNPKFRTLVTSRYLMPVVPILFASTAVYLVYLGRPLLARWVGTTAPHGQLIALGAALAASLLVVAPLVPLGRYYARAYERGDTNARILRLSDEMAAARRADEPVLIDETIGSELPDTGVTELRGFEYLLEFARVPHRAVRVTPSRLQDELRGAPSALAVLNARDAAEAATRLSVSPLDARPPAETGRMFDHRLYRLSPLHS
nr:glycosyltransferase family 39 protein [Chloroflexota bacterium]